MEGLGGVGDVSEQGFTDADHVGVGAAVEGPSVGGGLEKDGVACADGAAFGGEAVEVGEDGDFVWHCH